MPTQQRTTNAKVSRLDLPTHGRGITVSSEDRAAIINGLNLLGEHVSDYARRKGLGISSPHDLVCRLLHLCTEAAELADAFRCGNGESPNIAGFSHAEEELGDVVLIAMLIAQATRSRIGNAAIAKLESCSVGRPFRHGKSW